MKHGTGGRVTSAAGGTAVDRRLAVVMEPAASGATVATVWLLFPSTVRLRWDGMMLCHR